VRAGETVELELLGVEACAVDGELEGVDEELEVELLGG
jgi:hypothetical protein